MSREYNIETNEEDSSPGVNKKPLEQSEVSIHIGRVTGIINSKKSPLYSDSDVGLGGVYFSFINDNDKETDFNNVISNKKVSDNFAFPLSSFISSPPLLNELILIIPNRAPTDSRAAQYFYISSLNLFNTSNYNPDVSINDLGEEGIDLGFGIKESIIGEVNRLITAPGDTFLTGMFGNTIRLGNSNIDTPYKGEDNSPITIIRNGQMDTNGDKNFLYENINKDNSSIYLTKGQTISIDVISKNMQTFKVEEKNTTTEDDIQKLEGDPNNVTNEEVGATVNESSTTDNNEDVRVTNTNDEAFAEEGENIIFNDTSTDSTSNAETIIKKYRGYTIKRVLSSDSYGNPEQITEHYVIPNMGMEPLFDESDSTAISYFTNIIEESILRGDIDDLTT
tara:strand:- start:10224 stop:11402 length:1179 start_codon:yes stop_codon:yes gene_type:complete